jgi:hypothetical protein
MESKECTYCGEPFTGRANQKYCSIRCKSAINNERTAERDKEAKSIESRIRENRRILINLYSIFGDEEIPEIVISKTNLDTDYNNGISPSHDTIRVLDYSIKQLQNNNYLISKIF